MTQFDSTVRLRMAGVCALTAVLFATGCNTTPRGKFLKNRTVIHTSHAGTGKSLNVNPVFARLGKQGRNRR